jgi:hypothetical protein
MINYLALGDLEGARVESRRLRVMQDYLADEGSKQASLLGLGSYLAGFAFEMSKRYEQALRYYDEAAVDGLSPSLVEPVRRLAACSTYRTERLESLLGEQSPAGTCEPHPQGTGTVLIISQAGLAPYKHAERIPVGLAFAIAAHHMHGPGLTPEQQARSNQLVAKGLLTWINFPVMKKSPVRFVRTDIRIDGQGADVDLGMDVTAKVIEAWDSIKGTMMVAAITRMITRLVAGEVTEQAAKGGGAAGAVALLAGLAVQGTLTAADTPDTRSWVTLPSSVFITRVEVKAGSHTVEVTFSGKGGQTTVRKEIEVPDGGFVVLPVASMR